ncbi:TetR/AcrR family transcriptional regulator [Streptomyces sp. NPDC057908]|uniref:TetR/AcrR family transcriptional regulator n=1 Tax=Streptomyces sp. NPDC057908 TaxID=3346276 RepID=UPI0036E5DEA0
MPDVAPVTRAVVGCRSGFACSTDMGCTSPNRSPDRRVRLASPIWTDLSGTGRICLRRCSHRRHAARARLLTAADELFCAEGVRSVRIDRVIAHAGAAKATLCSAFGSKDGLARAYLQARHAATAEHMTRQLETHDDTPKERLVGAFEVQGLSFTEPGFRGCAFISASDDTPPGGVVEQAANDYRTWLHDLSLGLARQTGAKDAKSLAQQLVLLHAAIADPRPRRWASCVGHWSDGEHRAGSFSGKDDYRLHAVIDGPSRAVPDRILQRTGPMSEAEKQRCAASRPMTSTPVGADSAASSADKGRLNVKTPTAPGVRALRTVPLD